MSLNTVTTEQTLFADEVNTMWLRVLAKDYVSGPCDQKFAQLLLLLNFMKVQS